MNTVLVVDDEAGLVDALSTALALEGHRVQTARDGREALGKLERERPDVVLLDMMMPVMDGAGVIRAMQARPALRDIPVIVMSAAPWLADGLPHAARLTKPMDVAAVVRAIADVLRPGAPR